ncbi:MAG TPA: tripartite tricarboxylate transporter substrate binding protein [Casimicrobiaceae bacterium]|nr:tripartite tricarboxylate transporter substrate binding protein [Casimicrobiaceae bacterium]
MRSIAIGLGLRSCAFIAIAIAAMSGGAFAQPYPVKPIRLIVPLAAGSTADIGSRFVAQELSKVLGQPVVVENKPGAGGTIGTSELARAAPDGYTIGFASQGTLVFNQGIYGRPGYDSRKDFAPIALFARAATVLIVHPANAATIPAELVAAAKNRPGRSTFASGGSGTSHHLAGVLFGRATGTDLVHVPYTSAPRGVLAVMAKEVTMGFFNVPMVIGAIRDGRLKALGVTSLRRSPAMPQVPTLDEQGIKGFEVDTWAGFVAPAGTDPKIVERLHGELSRILAALDTRDKLGLQGFELATPMQPDEFAALIAADLNRWLPIVRASGAKPD